MSLRARLFLLVGIVVAVTTTLVTWTVSVSARAAFEAFDRERTAGLIAQIRREVATESEDIASRIDRIVAADAFQRIAIDIGRRTGDYGPFVGEAGSLAAGQGLDILDLVAEDGVLISSAEYPARFGYRHPWAVGRAAPAGSKAMLHRIDLPHESAIGVVAVRRVASGPRPLYVVGGRLLDRQFLKSLALPEGMRAWLYRNLEPQPSRHPLIDASGDAPMPAQLEPLVARVRQSGRESAAAIGWPDGRETVDAIPLSGPGGAVLGVLLLGSSGRELDALLARIRWSGIGFGAAGIALGLALSYFAASRVTRPVEQLAAAARQVSSGDWDVRTNEVEASGEVRDLANAFDTMTRQLVDHRERLVQAERVAAWRELARRLAHELKNPLFPLRLTIDNLRRARGLPSADFDEVFVESLTTLDTGLSNLNAVVGRFSDFARMPAPQLAAVAPNAIVEQAVALFRAQMQAGDRPPIAVKLDLDPTSPRIHADAEQLGRVVQNLMLNAIDAMPRGGELSIRSRLHAAVFRLAIADTGEGLTAEECSRLFTPYYTTKQHGTGLGLAIVQAVVADHNGKVWVDSAPGRGTTFHIELPEEQQST